MVHHLLRRRAAAIAVAGGLALSGCAAAPSAPQTTPVPLTISISVGGVSPSGQQVSVVGGSDVTLTITAAHDDVVHVHGYELEIPVKKGETVTKTFRADRLGRYEVETHEPAMIIALLDVR